MTRSGWMIDLIKNADTERDDGDGNSSYRTGRLSRKIIQPHVNHWIASKRWCSC